MPISKTPNEINEERGLHGGSVITDPPYEENELNEESPSALYRALIRRGLRLTVAGDQLRVSPASALSTSDGARIRAHKAGLIACVKAANELPPDCLAVFACRQLGKCDRAPRCRVEAA